MYTNSNPAEWLRLMADLEHQGLGELSPEQQTLPGFPPGGPRLVDLGLGPLEPDDELFEDDKSEHTYERPTCINPQTGAVEWA